MSVSRKAHVLFNFSKILSHVSRQNERSVSVGQKFLSQNADETVKSVDYEVKYTNEEKHLILKTINTCTMEELKRFHLTEAGIRKLVAKREKNDGFQNLLEVLDVDGIKTKVLERFFKSVLKSMLPKSTKMKSTLLTPYLDEFSRKRILTCTGIWISGNSISWAKLNRNYELLQWDCDNIGDVGLKEGPIAVVSSVATILGNVLSSDAYVMESDQITPFSRMNRSIYYSHLVRQQIVAAITGILGTRKQSSDEPVNENEDDRLIKNVYMMRPQTPARLFNLVIGSECISANDVVQKMLDQQVLIENKEETFPTIATDENLKNFYKMCGNQKREQLCWALLLAYSFVNLALTETTKVPNKTVNNVSAVKIL